MPLDAIKKSILADAEKRAEALNSEANAEASRILAEARESADASLRQAKEEAAKEAKRIRDENAAGLESERNAMIMGAKSHVIEHALKDVRSEAVRNLEKQNLEEILKKGIKHFSALTGNGGIIVKTSKKNAQFVDTKKYEVEFGDIEGFMLYTPDRKVALNATVDSIVDREMDTIRRIVADEIFTGKEERAIRKMASPKGRKAKKQVKAKAKKAKKTSTKKRGRR